MIFIPKTRNNPALLSFYSLAWLVDASILARFLASRGQSSLWHPHRKYEVKKQPRVKRTSVAWKKSIHVCDTGLKLRTERKPLILILIGLTPAVFKSILSCCSLFVIFIVITSAVSQSSQTKSVTFLWFPHGVAESQQIWTFSTPVLRAYCLESYPTWRRSTRPGLKK